MGSELEVGLVALHCGQASGNKESGMEWPRTEVKDAFVATEKDHCELREHHVQRP